MNIDSYDFGRIVIDGKSYSSDVIIFPNKVVSWWREEGHILNNVDIKEIVEERPEVLIVGTGYSGCMKVLAEVKEQLESLGIELIAERTREACNTYNRLSDKKVIAAFHLTC
ncbi:MAG: Mth938-like domain-containing protein [Candidatus Hydrothermarchaeales archaeon]